MIFYKRYFNFVLFSVNFYFKLRFLSFLFFNLLNWGLVVVRWKYFFVLCYRLEICVIVYVNRNYMGYFVFLVKERGNSVSK